jgi:hypothetical protein
MATRIVELEEDARAALRSALRKVPAEGAVQVALPNGSAPLDGPDEVFVLVLGPRGGLVTRKAVPAKDIDLRALRLLLLGAEAAVESLEPVALSPPLTTAEAALLGAAGLGDEVSGPGAFEKSLIEFQLLVKKSLPLDKVAKLLGVNESRLRQRLAEHTLYGLKEGGSWRVPRFQLDTKTKKLVRGIEKVLPHVRVDAHPLAVVRWFSLPHPDLVVGEDDEPVPPLRWLAGGRDPAIVAELAKEI